MLPIYVWPLFPDILGLLYFAPAALRLVMVDIYSSFQEVCKNCVQPSWRNNNRINNIAILIEKAPRIQGFSSIHVVGARGFEPPTPASRTQYSTRLSYAPTETTTLLKRPSNSEEA